MFRGKGARRGRRIENHLVHARCARAVEHALRSARPKTRYVVGADSRLQTLIARFVPDRLRDRLITKVMSG